MIIEVSIMADLTLESVLERGRFFPVFSLKKLTLMRITTILCNNQRLKKLIIKCKWDKDVYIRNREEFKAVEILANKMISEIDAIGIYKEMILEMIWPVACRIILWEYSYIGFNMLDSQLPHVHFWTHCGRIDSKRTAKYIIANEMISIRERFELACDFCLTEEIDRLWRNMEQDDKFWFLTFSNSNYPMITFWLNQLEPQQNISEVSLEELLLYSVAYRSLYAIKYLFNLMTEEMKSDKATLCFDSIREIIIESFFLQEDEIDMGFFFVSQMNELDKEMLFDSSFSVVLSLLLHSSGQSEFLKIWHDNIHFATAYEIKIVLHLIFDKFHLEIFRDHDYLMLFDSAWRMLPVHVKDFLRTESSLGLKCFCNLLQDDFAFILHTGLTSNISNLIASYLNQISSEIDFCFKRDKWRFLNFVIEEKLVTTAMLEKNRDIVLSKFPKRTQFIACKRLINFICDNSKKKKKQN